MRRLAGIPSTALVLAAMAACGGGDDDEGAESPSPAPSSTATAATADGSDPVALANEMIDHYVTLTDALVALIDQDLLPSQLAPEVTALKNEYIEIFVAMGYTREGMSDEYVSAFNSRATAGLFGLSFDHRESLNEYLSDLSADGEDDLAEEITSLNILTQYAQFELLWEQEPDETERLNLPSPAHERP